MKSHIYLLLLGISMFIVGCGARVDANNAPANVRRAENPNTKNESTSPMKSSGQDDHRANSTNQQEKNDGHEFYGCWGGMKGGLIEITAGKIVYTAQQRTKSYKFSNLRKKSDTDKDGYILEINANNGDLLGGRVIWLRIAENNDLILYGYRSSDDLASNIFAGAGEYVREECEK